MAEDFTIRTGGIDAEFMILDVGSAKTVGFRLGLGVGGRYLYAEGAVKRDPSGPRERVDSDVIIPVARASASLGFLDATLQVKVYLFQNVAIGAGYRYMGIDLEDRRGGDDFDIEMSIRGFFAELTIQF